MSRLDSPYLEPSYSRQSYAPVFTTIVYRGDVELVEQTFDNEKDALVACDNLMSDARYPWPTHAIVWHRDREWERVETDQDWQHAEWPDRVYEWLARRDCA